MILNELCLLLWCSDGSFSFFLLCRFHPSFPLLLLLIFPISLSLSLSRVLWNHGYFVYLSISVNDGYCFGCYTVQSLTSERLLFFWSNIVTPWYITCYYVATTFNCLGLRYRNSWIRQLPKFPNFSFPFSYRLQTKGLKRASSRRAVFSSTSFGGFARWVFLPY